MKYLILLIDKNELPIIRIELSYPRTTSEKIYTWNHNIKERNIVYNGEISKIYTLFRFGTNITTTIELLYKYTPENTDISIQLYSYNILSNENLTIKTRIIE